MYYSPKNEWVSRTTLTLWTFCLQLENLSRYLLDLSLVDVECARFLPSVRAAAAVLLSHKLLQPTNFVPSSEKSAAWSLAFYSGHVDHVLRPCMARYARLLLKAEKSKFQVSLVILVKE